MKRFLAFGVMVAFLLMISAGVDAAQVLKTTYPCSFNASQTCYAKEPHIVAGNENSYEIVYHEWSLNTTDSRGLFFYEKFDGTKYIIFNTTNVLSSSSYDYAWDAYKSGNYVYLAISLATITPPLYVYRLDLTTGGYTAWASITASEANDMSIAGSDASFLYVVSRAIVGAGSGDMLYRVWLNNGTMFAANLKATSGAGVTMYGADLNSTSFKYYSAGYAARNLTSYLKNGTSLGYVVVGDHSSDTQLFGVDWDSFVFSTSRDGNYELYFKNNDGTNLTRLTSTAVNEMLSNVYRASDGSVYLAYNSTNYVAYLDYICASDAIPVLGRKCGAGVTTKEIPDVVLTVWDEGCCQQAYWGDYISCKHTCLIGSEDWIHVKYMVDGKIALPASSDSDSRFNATNYLHGVNASCTACCPSCSNKPGCAVLPFANAAAKNANLDDWSLNLGEDAIFGTYPWKSGNIVVTCTTNESDTNVYATFKLENSAANYSSWFLTAGGGDGAWNDRLKSSQKLNVRLTDEIIPIQNWRGEYNCYVDSPLALVTEGLMALTKNEFRDSDDGVIQVQTRNYAALTQIGNTYPEVPYTTSCFGKNYANAVTRMPSRTHQKSVLVETTCTSFDTTYLVNFQFENYVGNATVNSTYYTKQHPYFSFKWVDPSAPPGYGGWDVNQFGTCSYNVYNATSGALVSGGMSQDYLDALIRGFYGDGLTDSSSSDGYFSVGNYSLNVTCTDTVVGKPYCMAPVTASFPFYVVESACEGTGASCGTTSCEVCSDFACTCEDNATVSVQNKCFEQSCETGSNEMTACYDVCRSHLVYTVSAYANSPSYPCVNPDIRLTAKILKNGGLFDASTIGAYCTVMFADFSSILTGFQPYGSRDHPFIYDSLTKVFNYHYVYGAELDSFEFECGKNYTAYVTCGSDYFKSKKQAIVGIVMSSLDYCSDGTMKSACVSTWGKSVNPNYWNYCSSTGLLTNSSVCGCPAGYNLNSVTGGCDKSKSFSFDLIGLLTLTNILIVLLVGVPALALFRELNRRS
jgi:hypothetical protein